MDLKALHALPKRGLTKTLRVMKLTAIILLSVCLTASANGFSQKVTLSEKNARLEKVFTSIKQQTGYEFLYTYEMLQNAGRITIELKSVELPDALNTIFKDQPLTYSIIEKTVVIKPKAVQIATDGYPLPPINVKGRLVDEKGDGVLASITVSNTNIGTTTNADGYFELKNVEANVILSVTGVNIEPFLWPVKGKADLGTVTIQTKVQNLNEVIVKRGYWEDRKQNMVGSVVKIEAKEIEKQPVTSPLLALQGLVAGLQISPVTGVPGQAPKIRIRGENSIRFNGNNPLYVIDGVPIESTEILTQGNILRSGSDPLSTLNVSNIESIEILKDADATAIYGSRGANGVILITTKQGVRNGVTSVDLSVYHGIGKMNKKAEVLNLQEYLSMRREAFSNDGAIPNTINARDLLLWDTTRYTDWQKVLLGGTSNVSDVQLNLTSGNSFTTFRFGLGYHKETYVTPGDFYYQSLSGQFNLTHRSKNNKLKASFSLSYGTNKNKLFSDNDFVSKALSLAPNAPAVYKPDGSLNWEPYPNGASSWENPFSDILQTHNANVRNYITSANIHYDINRWLYTKINLGFSDLMSDEIIKYPLASLSPDAISSGVTAENYLSSTKRRNWIVEPQIGTILLFNNRKSRITALVGSTFQESLSQVQTIIARGYTADIYLGSVSGTTRDNVTISDNNTEYRYIGVYTRIGLSHRDRYILNLTARRDGSSRFAPGNKFGNFGAVGIGWIFSNEPFIKSQKILNYGKVRASLGYTGNDQIGDYNYYNLYRLGTGSQNYGGNIGLLPNSLFNSDYQWESTRKFEVGIELSFFNNRISTEINWYSNRSANQLVNYQLPLITGFSSVFTNHNAVIDNKGFEFSLQTQNIKTKSFSWNSSFNISINRNKLVAFPGIESSTYQTLYKIGEPLTVQRLYIWKGINPQTGIHEFEDTNADGVINSNDMVFFDPVKERFSGGLKNFLSVKGFELSFLFQFSYKNASRDFSDMPGFFSNQPAYVKNRWQKVGQVTDIAKYSQNPLLFTNFNRAYNSNYNIQDGSFWRLKTLSLSYSLPRGLLSKLTAKEAKVFIQGQNLLTVSKYVGLDPETGSYSLPPLKIFTFGAQFKF